MLQICSIKNFGNISFAGLYAITSFSTQFTKLYPYSMIDYFVHIGKYNYLNVQSDNVLPIISNNKDYYKTDNVTLNSDTLQKCSFLLSKQSNNFFN